MKKIIILITLAFLICVNAFAYDVDVIITNAREQIQCIIISQEDDYITYHSVDSNDKQVYQIAKSDVKKIYMHNTDQAIEYPKPTSQQEVKETTKNENTTMPNPLFAQPSNSLARVEKVNGILVFTDCTPVAQYDVIGEVSISGLERQQIRNLGAQYQDVRDELIKTAKAANGLAEGVILTLVTGGIDKAYILKFRDHSEDWTLAYAKRYRGIYVFCDCTPLSSYDYLGSLKGKTTLTPQYTNLRDNFLKQCSNKYKNANGLIFQLVLGGKDSAEAIKF